MCIICENNGYIPPGTKVLDCSGCYTFSRSSTCRVENTLMS